ncbi:hypothetical protein DYB34_002635 [Aphanomyces astaci]|uniref:TIR domain-containing protein n=3 Tax=Aphanomyces astaci TaxID=112090 RepID=A0A3R6WI65_APHAT|nr:hypothetical protein DYB34_002635 [Aphanomyces astaci]
MHVDDSDLPPPPPLATHINLIQAPTTCHAAFVLAHSPRTSTQRFTPTTYQRASSLQTDDDVRFDRYIDGAKNPDEASPLDLAVKWSVRTMRQVSLFSYYGNTFVSARMISWTVQITLIHAALLASLFAFTPELFAFSYSDPSGTGTGRCDDIVDGIETTVYAAVANVIVCLPTSHAAMYDHSVHSITSCCFRFQLYTAQRKKSYFHTICELLVMMEIVFLGCKLVLDVYLLIVRHFYRDCLNQLPTPLKAKVFVLLALDVYVYVACWYQITLFNRMRDVALGQRNMLPTNHLFEFSDPDWWKLWQISPSRRRIDKLLAAGFDANALDKIQTPSLMDLSQWYQTIFNVLVFLRSTNFSEASGASAHRYGPSAFWCQTLLTPLHVAMMHNESAIVGLLLAAHADPNQVAASNQRKCLVPPLFHADCAVCLRLLMDAGANLLHIPGNGFFMTAYEVVVRSGNFNLADAMVEWGADIALTPMHAAAADGDWKTVATFLEAGIDPNILGENSTGRFHRTPLHWAAMRGQARVVEVLVTAPECNVNAVDLLGMTPLSWACVFNHDVVVELLLRANADVDTRGRGVVLLVAGFESHAQRPREAVLRLLRAYGGNIHARHDITVRLHHGESALHVALKRGHVEMAKLLVQMGLDVTAVDAKGVRAIDCATSSEMQYAVKKAAGQRDVMISYCHSHRSFALKVRQSLEDHHITTWIDQLDPTGIGGGSEWREEIARGIQSASVVLAVLSEDYPQSQWCMKELAFAKLHNVPVVGITCGNVVVGDELEVYLWTRQAVDFRPSILSTAKAGNHVTFEFDNNQYHVHIRQLLDGLRDEIEERRVVSAALKHQALELHVQHSHDGSRRSGSSSVVSVAASDAYVFLCHGDCHVSFAKALQNQLQAVGIRCKLDQPKPNRQMLAKDHVLDPNCIAVLLVLSDVSTKRRSETLRDQLAFAENRAKPIVPILLSSQVLDMALLYSLSRSSVHHFNASIGMQQSVDNLVPDLRALQRRATHVVSPSGPFQRQTSQAESIQLHPLRESRISGRADGGGLPTYMSPAHRTVRVQPKSTYYHERVVRGVEWNVGPVAAAALSSNNTINSSGRTNFIKQIIFTFVLVCVVTYVLGEHIAAIGLPTAAAAAPFQSAATSTSAVYVSMVSIPIMERVLPLKHLAEELLHRGYRVSIAMPEVVDRYTFAGMDVAASLGIPFVINNPFLLLDIDDPPAYVPAPLSHHPSMEVMTVFQRCMNGYFRLRFRLLNLDLVSSSVNPRTSSHANTVVLTNTVFGLEYPRPLTPLHRMHKAWSTADDGAPWHAFESWEVYFSPLVAHTAVLQRAAFFVTAGGFHHVQEALCVGRPVLGIPFSAEQVPPFAKAATRLGGLLTSAGGVSEAANVVLAVADRGASALIPAHHTQPVVKTFLLDVYAVYGAVLCGVAVILRTLLSALFSVFQRKSMPDVPKLSTE